MSRFWAAGGESSDSDDDDSDKSDKSSSSDDSSDNSSDSDDDDNSNDNNNNAGGGLGQTGQQEANRWLAMSDDSSDEDSVRVVLSGKERFQETITTSITAIRKAMKARDYFEIQTLFDTLSKTLIKNKQYLVSGVPRPLVRILCDLEDYATERLADKEQFKTLSARQGRALNRFKLTFKKHNRQYQTVMTAYRANPTTDGDDVDGDDVDDDAKEKSKNDDDDDDDDDDSSSNSSSSSSSESDDDDDDDDDDNDKVKTKTAASKKKKDSDDDSDATDSDEDEWASDDDSSSSDSDGDGAVDAYAQLKGRARWLKKNTVTAVKVVKNKEERAKAREEARLAAQAAAASQEAVSAVKSVLPEENLSAAIIQRRIQELAATRRGKDTVKQLRELESIHRLSIQFGPRTEVPVIMYVIAAQFALQRTLDDCMDTGTWKACASYLQRIAHVLLNEGYTLGVENIDASDMIIAKASGNTKMKAALSAQDGAMAAVAADEKFINPLTNEAETADERAERLRLEKESAMTEAERMVIPVVGSLELHLTRLEEEYTKSLQRTSHHSEQYVTRLRDEMKLVSLLSSFQAYFERVNATDSAAVMAQLRIEHLYYRHDSIAKQVDKAGVFHEKYGEVHMLHPGCIYDDTASTATSDFTQFHPGALLGKPKLAVEDVSDDHLYDFTGIISKLSQYVYKFGTKKSQMRAMICQIYHHALHDSFSEARDLLLMSHLQDTIYDRGDIPTMILFNRMMVTVGMCAFRSGRIYDAHQCLSDVCAGRVRELLAQGVNTNRFSEKTPEQEKAEKRRLVPYHQHINLDLLEACHLISAMLLEVPNMAGAAVDAGGNDPATGGAYRRHRIISRTFRKYIDQYHHQVFTGPPEQTRDFVMRAAKALMKGDWKKCIDLIQSMDVWVLVPGDDAVNKIVSMLEEKVKEEGLRTFLFAFSAQYDSLSLGQLCGMFALSKSEVHSVVSKMMINRELLASWDQPTETVVLRKTDLSQLQILALQFSEKVTSLVEANERLLDAQRGSGHKEDYWKGDRGDDRGRGGRGGSGRGGSNNYNNGGRDGNSRGRGSGGRGRGDNRGSGGRGRDGGGGRSGGRGGVGGRGRGRGSGGNSRGGNNRTRY